MSTRNKGNNKGFDFDFKDSCGENSGFGAGFGASDNVPMSVRGKNKGFGFDIPENPDVTDAMDTDDINGPVSSSWGKGDSNTVTSGRPEIVPSLMGQGKLGLDNSLSSPISGDEKDGTLTPRAAVRSSPLVTSGSGLLRQGSGSRLSGATATAAATVEFSFDSPRIALPPGGAIGAGDYRSQLGRPQSAEKKRWLARANLLREGDSKVAKMAQEDEEASRILFGQEKYIYLEYLEWMGEDMFKPGVNECEIKCGQCTRAIGGCSWAPQPR